MTDVMRDLEYSYFYTCGPEPMLKAIDKIAKTEKIDNTSYAYVIMVAKGKDSFYILNFISLTKDKMQDKVFSYIDTIEFE